MGMRSSCVSSVKLVDSEIVLIISRLNSGTSLPKSDELCILSMLMK